MSELLQQTQYEDNTYLTGQKLKIGNIHVSDL
jgi:hypothetical protein